MQKNKPKGCVVSLRLKVTVAGRRLKSISKKLSIYFLAFFFPKKVSPSSNNVI